MAHDVFISYASEDKLTANAACAALEAKGVRCWIAPRDILPGQDWGDAILGGLEHSRVMVLVFSSHSNGSKHVKKELLQAVENEIVIVPFRIQDTYPTGALKLHLTGLHWLDALSRPLEDHLEKLAEMVWMMLKTCNGQLRVSDYPTGPPLCASEAPSSASSCESLECHQHDSTITRTPRRGINLGQIQGWFRRRNDSALAKAYQRAVGWFMKNRQGQRSGENENVRPQSSSSSPETDSGRRGVADSGDRTSAKSHGVFVGSSSLRYLESLGDDPECTQDLRGGNRPRIAGDAEMPSGEVCSSLDEGPVQLDLDGYDEICIPETRLEEDLRVAPEFDAGTLPLQVSSLPASPLSVVEMGAQVRSDAPEFRGKRPAISLRLGEKVLCIIPESAATPCRKSGSIKGIVRDQKPVAEIYEESCKLLEIPLPGIKSPEGIRVDVNMTMHHDGNRLRIKFCDKQSDWTIEQTVHLREWDQIDCTVFSQSEVVCGENFMVQAFLHLPTQVDEAEDLAKLFDDEAQKRGSQSLTTQVARGSSLTFHLVMPGLEIDNDVQETVWYGSPTSAQFGVHVPAGLGSRAVISTLTVSQNGIPIGHIKFKVKTLEVQIGGLVQPGPVGDSYPYERFFVSYASQDRPEVVKRVQILRLVGKKVFQDLLDLDPGARWEPQIYRWIDESDALLLFWSSNAKNSEWVMKECQYAIQKKGIEFIIPVIIEGPPPVEPPPELAELHMNDRLIYFMQ